MNTFGQAFATDNAQIALSVDPNAYVTDFHSQAPVALKDAPLRWLLKLALHLPTLGRAIAATLFYYALPVTRVIGLALWRAMPRAKASRLSDIDWWRTSTGRLALLGGLVFLSVSTNLVVTGCFDLRYFSALVWLAALAALLGIARAPRMGDGRVLVGIAAFAVIATFKTTLLEGLNDGAGWWRRRHIGFNAALNSPAEFQPLLACLDSARPDIAVLSTDQNMVARFGALSGQRAAILPRNWSQLDEAEIADFLERFGIGYIVPDPQLSLPARMIRRTGGACDTRVLRLVPRSPNA